MATRINHGELKLLQPEPAVTTILFLFNALKFQLVKILNFKISRD